VLANVFLHCAFDLWAGRELSESPPCAGWLPNGALLYNEVRPRLSLSPIPPEVERVGRVRALPILGALHHRYVRV
jgi:hypothetical protein